MNWLKRNLSTILSILAVGGVGATAVLAVKGKPKADARLDALDENATIKDKVVAAAPAYLPAAGAGVGTIALILGANVLSRRQQASLMSAYALLQQQYAKYNLKGDNMMFRLPFLPKREVSNEPKLVRDLEDLVKVLHTVGGGLYLHDSNDRKRIYAYPVDGKPGTITLMLMKHADELR